MFECISNAHLSGAALSEGFPKEMKGASKRAFSGLLTVDYVYCPPNEEQAPVATRSVVKTRHSPISLRWRTLRAALVRNDKEVLSDETGPKATKSLQLHFSER